MARLDSDVVARIAGESEESAGGRLVLDTKLTTLREAQKIGYRLHHHNSQSKLIPKDLFMTNATMALTVHHQHFEQPADEGIDQELIYEELLKIVALFLITQVLQLHKADFRLL